MNKKKSFYIEKVEINVYKSGIKNDKTDVLFIKLPDNSSIAGIFTKSHTCSSAVKFCKKNGVPGTMRISIINSKSFLLK